jgi:hypothetical protein
MAKSALADTEFRRNEKVVAVQELPGVPVGTPGKVLLVDGLTWMRYRVLFENGEDRGTIDGSYLARPQDVDRRIEEIAAGEARAAAAEAAAESGADGADGAEVGEGNVVNGVSVPSHLLERSKRARERLGV